MPQYSYGSSSPLLRIASFPPSASLSFGHLWPNPIDPALKNWGQHTMPIPPSLGSFMPKRASSSASARHCKYDCQGRGATLAQHSTRSARGYRDVLWQRSDTEVTAASASPPVPSPQISLTLGKPQRCEPASEERSGKPGKRSSRVSDLH